MRTTPQKFVTIPPIIVLTLIAAMAASGGEYCKWTDESGVVHYDESCPDDVTSSVVEAEGKRTESQKIAGDEVSDSLLSEPIQPIKPTKKSQKKKTGTTADLSHQDSKDFSKMSADQLDVLCEEEREKRLAPEREQLIKICVEDTRSSQEHCENYYSDYGDAIRNDGTGLIQRALYVDLPECIAAWEARHKDN